MVALEAAEHFCGNSNTNNKNKTTGTFNVAESKDKSDSINGIGNGATKTTTESWTSKLTEDMTICELLRLTGQLHTTISMRATNGKI